MSITPKMRPKRAAPSRLSSKGGALKKNLIVRDPTFSRAVADDVAILHLGRDVELAFLQYGGLLKTIEEKEEHFNYSGDDTVAEVSRIRLNFSEAVTMSLRILQYGIGANRVKGEAVARSIQEWIADADIARAGGVDGDGS